MKITKEYDLDSNVHVVHLDISDDPELLAMQQAIDWSKYCNCSGIDENPTFHDDNTCKDEGKHHWHCSMCGLISQIG